MNSLFFLKKKYEIVQISLSHVLTRTRWEERKNRKEDGSELVLTAFGAGFHSDLL